MIYSLFDHRYSFCTVFWVSSFYLSVNIVVLYQFTVTCIETWSVRSLERRKGSKIAIVFSGRRRRWMDLWKQMSSKWSFTCICGIFLPLNSSATTVYARSAFYPSQQSSFCILHPACVLLSVCSLHFTLSQHFTPGPQSAVRSPQSIFLHRPILQSRLFRLAETAIYRWNFSWLNSWWPHTCLEKNKSSFVFGVYVLHETSSKEMSLLSGVVTVR